VVLVRHVYKYERSAGCYSIVPPIAGSPQPCFGPGGGWPSGRSSPGLVAVSLPRVLGVGSGRGLPARLYTRRRLKAVRYFTTY
jgi:hypothetical protein